MGVLQGRCSNETAKWAWAGEPSVRVAGPGASHGEGAASVIPMETEAVTNPPKQEVQRGR